MVDFIKENWPIIVGAVLFVIFLIRFLRTLAKHLKLSKRIDQEGIEKYAVVSRVVIDTDADGDTTRTTYVAYRDDTGVERESPLAASITARYEQGDRLMIKFLPGEYDMVKPVKGQ